ncbi:MULTISPECIES: FAD-dependent monooxygenase [unclassified Sphingomonas]|uniref:FAD-dependent monooxygenase n=1 Tax=unclassified Sphingomonas TaxID=196159 RepID=UPI002269BF58
MALVIGGGIGGMAAALALSRAGQPVELIEADPEWNALGAGLTLNGGAMRALADLGVLEQVKAAGFGSVGPVRACDVQGHIVGEGPSEPIFGEGIPNMGGILRPRLHEVMREAITAARIPVRRGAAAQAFGDTDEGIWVTTSDGESRMFGWVVAADGLFSKTRGLLFPDAPKPSFTGQGCWRAVVPRPEEVTATWIYSGTGAKAGFNPISQEAMYVYLIETAEGNPRIPEDQWLELLRKRLSRFGGHFRQIVRDLNETSLINYRPLEVVLVPPPWHRGHVLLVGDAAHATTPHVGYGAGLAIEDAVVLGAMVAEADDVSGLFRAFTERRFQRCKTILEGSVAIGDLEMAAAPFLQQRELSARLGAVIREPV